MLKLTLLSNLFLTSLIVNADVLPNRALTPGVARAVDVITLCTTSTSLVRNVPQNVKDTTYTSYGLKGNDRTACPQGYEIDHLISLELGGSNDIKNLWPQSFCGANNAHIKDALENKLHVMICSKQISIQNAQTCITSNWITCYSKVMK